MQGVTKSHILEAYSMTDNYNILLNEKKQATKQYEQLLGPSGGYIIVHCTVSAYNNVCFKILHNKLRNLFWEICFNSKIPIFFFF